MIKVATVCSGIGSPEQALKNLGVEHEISFACEIDKYPRQTYLANFKPNMMLEDMTKETWEGEGYYSDLFIGGIPCQSFSLAGKRLGELDPRGLLFYDFYRYVQVQQPKCFIIENVKGLISDDNGKTFRNWIQLLGRSENTHVNMFNHPDSLEYNLHWKVLNSKDFGVPQNRERVFLVGIRKDLPNTFRFPIGWRLDIRLKDILEDNVHEKYYLSDKMLNGFISHAKRQKEKGNGFTFEPTEGEGISKTVTTGEGKRGYTNFIKECKVEIDGEVTPNSQAGKVYNIEGISPTIISGTHGYALGYINEPICVAMRGREPQVLTPVRTEYGKQIRKEYEQGKIKTERKNIQQLEPRKDGITNTITSVQKDNLILEYKGVSVHPFSKKLEFDGFKDGNCPTLLATDYKAPKCIQVGHRIRRLTPLECFRLQGFPDDYIKPCSDSQTYKQAGNTITVNVIQAIIKNLLPCINQSPT